MISLEKAIVIAKEAERSLVISECVDIGGKFAFSYETANGDLIPGIGVVCVDKSDGKISRLSIPPLENLDILEKGTPIEIN